MVSSWLLSLASFFSLYKYIFSTNRPLRFTLMLVYICNIYCNLSDYLSQLEFTESEQIILEPNILKNLIINQVVLL